MAQSVQLPMCDICNEAVSNDLCEECNQNYCERCKNIHSKINTCRHHSFAGKHVCEQEDENRCAEHSAEYIYCCEDCQTLICKTCIITTHKSHSIANIGDAYERKVQNFRRDMKVYVTKIKSVEAKIDKTKKDITSFQSKCLIIESTIQSRRDTAIKQLKELADTMLSEFCVSKTEQLHKLNEHLVELEGIKGRSESIMAKCAMAGNETPKMKSFRYLGDLQRNMLFNVPCDVVMSEIIHDDIHWNRTMRELYGTIRVVDPTKKKDAQTQARTTKYKLYQLKCLCQLNEILYMYSDSDFGEITWKCTECERRLRMFDKSITVQVLKGNID